MPALRHLGLLYPTIGPACASSSAHEFAEGFMLTRSFLTWSWSLYAAQARTARDPRYDLTVADGALSPPTTLIITQFDPLRDEAEAFAARLACAGIPVSVRRDDGMIHAFAGFFERTARAQEAIREIALACKRAPDANFKF
jgi:acetyl esterase